MIELPASVAVSISVALPWLCGFLLLRRLFGSKCECHVLMLAGHGFFVGMLLTTYLLRVWYELQLPANFLALSLALAALTGVILWLTRRRAAPFPCSAQNRYHAWEKAVIAVLLGLIALRYYTIVHEVMLRPLFPWDAWMNWAPKAVIWFHEHRLVPFVDYHDWLQTPAGETVFTLGNKAAWKYPETVPLIQLWGMLAAGTSDSTLIYLGWPLLALSLGIALYGHLRQGRLGAPLCMLAVYMLLNMPYFDVHAILPGYADIWMAAAFGLGCLTVQEWHDKRDQAYAWLSVLYAVACFQMKLPGMVLGSILLAVLLLSLFRLTRRRQILLLSPLILLAAGAFVGIDIDVPSVGRFVLNFTELELPVLGHFDIRFHNVSDAFLDAYLLMINWNILWYLLPPLLLAKLLSGGPRHMPSPTLVCILLATGFLLFVFYFTSYYREASNQVTLNRASLYTLLPIIYYLFRDHLWWQRKLRSQH